LEKKREPKKQENLFYEDAGTMETIQQITNAYESGAVGEAGNQSFEANEEKYD